MRLNHPRGQKVYTLFLQRKVHAHGLLDGFRKLSENRTSAPSQEQVLEHEELDKILMSGWRQANSRCRRLHISAVHSLQQVNMSQLRLQLVDHLIERNKDGSKVKLKTVTKLSKITGRRWWLGLCRV